MDDIDAADSSRGGAESEDATDGTPEDLEELADGDRETEKPEADGDGVSAEPIGSESPDHDEAGHAAAGDMDALGDADDDAHGGDIWDRPRTPGDLLSAPTDDESAIRGDLHEQGNPGKPSAETAVADEGAPLPETAGAEEPTASEEATDTTPVRAKRVYQASRLKNRTALTRTVKNPQNVRGRMMAPQMYAAGTTPLKIRARRSPHHRRAGSGCRGS
ncbi:hypothetical protein CRV15_28995 (plasmid) [Streptomyces clavuligerus]|uniref:Uncharacterized protein n=2 Tax=Streptomyces clavuligerus TaxID=1901 RepID=B5GUF8_STRCL|nr:hypothetical protein SSCG_03208 [Streptomyces clavuligerus]EFG03672.1 Hypothetical protein SCLAV_p0181 [Streptomyces clavuligerus]MBY6307776.1 hypothetical protein [Streptomyces clavuligerus]QCS10884.1 hypothetical protein CRV15_28995 [Streptomyces clavuligerus]QPJ98522.1 hypothetical protein GE265_35365 [Streptomyces clavuligerus]